MSEGKRSLKAKFSRYSTDELQEVYHENNQKEFSLAELEVIREMLNSRGAAIPDQLEFPRTRKNADAKAKQDTKSEEVKSQLEIVLDKLDRESPLKSKPKKPKESSEPPIIENPKPASSPPMVSENKRLKGKDILGNYQCSSATGKTREHIYVDSGHDGIGGKYPRNTKVVLCYDDGKMFDYGKWKIVDDLVYEAPSLGADFLGKPFWETDAPYKNCCAILRRESNGDLTRIGSINDGIQEDLEENDQLRFKFMGYFPREKLDHESPARSKPKKPEESSEPPIIENPEPASSPSIIGKKGTEAKSVPVKDPSEKPKGDKTGCLSALLINMGYLVGGLICLRAAFLGIELHVGQIWAWLCFALILIVEPIGIILCTIGAFFGAKDVWGWHWFLALLFVAPRFSHFCNPVVS